jgi:sulfate adenylyltransferase subunit 2
MDTLAQTFLAEIERHLTQKNLEASAFGKQALGDPNFIFDLRKGRSPSTRTMDKVRAFMAAAPAAQASATGGAAARLIASPERLSHLERLEAESIHIIREVAAECEKPVMLYSIGKDSAVMLHPLEVPRHV